MPPEYFPLRWESTGDQWWYASPIDWAAANGLYDVVRELLHIDTNLLIKLSSLRRIHRLETVWDDEAAFHDVAECRSRVARKLLLECEDKRGYNSLIRAGYGGWLLYTAASAGDIEFVSDLLRKDPLLVFGEGEYGVTDIFYAAARSRNREVFWMVYDCAFSPGNGLSGKNGRREELGDTVSDRSGFQWEMRNRAVHAAARGGNLEVLRKLIGGGCDVSVFRDAQGSTILHSAASRGQVEVVKDLIASFDLSSCLDNQGNTALHVAVYRGNLNVVETLIQASPSIVSVLNNYGETFLHLAVAGFRTPGFHRADHQMELMRELVSGKVVDIFDIINVRNRDGRTALHLAVSENIQTNLVELLMKVPSINLNIRDADGMTPLDLLRRRPKSASSEILIKQLISAGGIANRRSRLVRSALVSHLKVHGLSGSPGASFRIPDAEMYLYMDIDNKRGICCDPSPEENASCLSEQTNDDSGTFSDSKRVGSVNLSAGRLKSLFQWSRKKERKVDAATISGFKDDDSLQSRSAYLEDHLIPLRQQYTKMSSLPANKRVLSFRSSLPSPMTRKKFTAGLMHGVLLAKPQLASTESYPSSYSGSSLSSPTSVHKHPVTNLPGISSHSKVSNSAGKQMNRGQSLNKRLMNQYLCFGAQRLAVEDPIASSKTNQSYDHALMV